MPSKHRIAVLVALLFTVPAGVAALEQAAPSAIAESVESRADAQPASQPASQPVEGVAAGNEQVIGSAPDGGFVRATPSDTFPKGSDVEWEMPPVQLAYFERLERQRGPLVARGDVFPRGSEVEWEMPPVQLAYFDQLEHSRVAAAQPATPAAAPVASAAPADESRNPLQRSADYISGLLKLDNASVPADNTAAASDVR